MNVQLPDPLTSAKADSVVRVLAAGNDAFVRNVRAALDTPEASVVDATATAEGVMETVAMGAIDCIVLDKTVGQQNSFELCERLAKKLRNPPAIVLLTDDGSTKTLLKAFRTGLSDCVPRGTEYATELRAAIRRSVDRAEKAREINDEIDYLAKLAKSDRLTGLPNRAFLEDRVANLVASGERHGGSFALFMIDVDNFRQINDIHGHAVGDQALKMFGRRLMLTSRASDAFGRFGGDEFLYLIDRAVSEETVTLVCDRLASALAFSMDLESVGLSLSASIGAAIFPSDAGTPETLVAAASRAMDAAKQRSRRYCLAREAATSLAEEVTRGGSPVADPIRGGFADAGPRVIVPEAPVGHRGENRRIEHRNRVFKRGRIIFGDGFSTMDCVVRDLSSHGARLSVEDQVTLPVRFTFSLSDGGATYPAVRRWQRGKSIGIEFSIEQGVAPRPQTRA